MIAGSKRGGVLQTILGAVLVVGALALGPVGIGAIAGSTAMSIGLMGGSMMIGGVVQMLSPQPGGLASRQDPDNAPSYAFGGPVNTTAIAIFKRRSGVPPHHCLKSRL